MSRPASGIEETTHTLRSGDWSVLALLAEGPSHGWAIASKLARDGEVGEIWSLGRPLVYEALDRLERQRLIRAAGLERGARGPHRVVYDVTQKGREAVRGWLARPVEHTRDIRSQFLLKVVLAQRAGMDLAPLLVAQRRVLTPYLAWIESQLDDASSASERTILSFRLGTVEMIVAFIDAMLVEGAHGSPPRARASDASARTRAAGRSQRAPRAP